MIRNLPLKIFYYSSGYVSHARCAEAYRRIIEELGYFTDSLEQANVVILHTEPQHYSALLGNIPALKSKYLIGYCVWEASHLPKRFQYEINQTDELWTASTYCQNILLQHHDTVIRIPHVAEYHKIATPQDTCMLNTWLNIPSDSFIYLALAAQRTPRKNLQAVIASFKYVQRYIPHAWLVVKSMPPTASLDPNQTFLRYGNHTIFMEDFLSPSLVHALYQRCHVYVSAHCSEGWGLTLMDALLLGKAVVATAYSGNLDFMTPENSFLVTATEQYIKPEDTPPYYETSMRWAYPHQDSLEDRMIEAFRAYQDGTLQNKTNQAHEDLQRYDRAHISRCIYERLTHIANLLPSDAPYSQRPR